MFHRLPRVIDISNSSLFSSYLSPKFQRREEPSYVYQVSVIFSLIICTIVLRFEGTCVAAFGSLLRFLLKELPAHWFIAVHTVSSTLAPLTARDKIITEVRVVRVVCTFDGLLMCSNMGDTAATTFQLLYEVNEDVIIANVAWAISDLRLKEATLQSCCDFAPLYIFSLSPRMLWCAQSYPRSSQYL